VLIPLLLGSLVGLASAPPVTLARCEVSAPSTVYSGGDVPPTTVGGYALRVRFSDIAAEPISRVTFTLGDGASVSDVGTFSPGVTIDHSLPLASTEAATCSVSAVTFADGTAWKAH
jgi:hypothetical protein